MTDETDGIDDDALNIEARRLSEPEVHAFFRRLFPQGFGGADVVEEIAPEGWERSPLLACVRTCLDENDTLLRMPAVTTEDEVTELVAKCLWDVFSDNHDVVAEDGRLVDIGTFRGAAEFLDAHAHPNRTEPDANGYMEYYMGTIRIWQRADLAPIYAAIFRRLRALNADWLPDGVIDSKTEPLAILRAYREVFFCSPRQRPRS
ncbi:MAG TPA: hypothetical protein VEA16_09165 [Vicinamibacterales bacterium]|nr:hypothetical protein [Vicinamibacterales bacterium]